MSSKENIKARLGQICPLPSKPCIENAQFINGLSKSSDNITIASALSNSEVISPQNRCPYCKLGFNLKKTTKSGVELVTDAPVNGLIYHTKNK